MHDAEFFHVTSADGTRIAAERAGPASGPGVILIHGVLHSRLIWKKQFADPALSKLRLLAFDVRGHGDSDKPMAREAYRLVARQPRHVRLSRPARCLTTRRADDRRRAHEDG
jgi:pimeloyl-ACP methyl ester carboxylesterase